MENNFVKVMSEITESIHSMNEETRKDFDLDYIDVFPAMASRKVILGGKEYKMKVTIELKEL